MRYARLSQCKHFLFGLALALTLLAGAPAAAPNDARTGAVLSGRDLTAFAQWRDVLNRFDAAKRHAPDCRGKTCPAAAWRRVIAGLESADLAAKLAGVNNRVNRVSYVPDSANWSAADYWATPYEFLAHSGDCEDYAVAKYLALRTLGVDPATMRILIVQDTRRNTPHAVLKVATPRGSVLLDNQADRLVAADQAQHYRPIYAVNERGWWLYTARAATIPASR